MTLLLFMSVMLCIVGIICDIAFLNTHITYLHHFFQVCIIGGQLGILFYLLMQKRKTSIHNEENNTKHSKTSADNAGSSEGD